MSRSHNTFTDVDIHTAKCDLCGKNNKQVIKRCTKCGMQICTPCLILKGGDGRHSMNEGDQGYAAALAAKEKKDAADKVLKAKKKEKKGAEEEEEEEEKEEKVKRRKRTRRRRVVIEESEEEEGDYTNDEHDRKRSRQEPADEAHQLMPRRLSDALQADHETDLADARHGKRPQLRIEELSPSSEGTSNPVTSTTTQFPEWTKSPMAFGTDGNADYPVDAATMGGVDALLSLAAGSDTSRRSSNNGPEVPRLRGGDLAPGSFSDQFQGPTSGVDFFSPNSPAIVDRYVTQFPAHYPVIHRPMALPVDYDPLAFQFQEYASTPADVQNYNAYTPAEPTWQSTVSGLFPGQDIDFDNPPWSSAATNFEDRAENVPGNGHGDGLDLYFDGDLPANADAAHEATASGGRSGTASGSRSSKTRLGDEHDQGWTAPDEDEDTEDGEIKENRVAATSSR